MKISLSKIKHLLPLTLLIAMPSLTGCMTANVGASGSVKIPPDSKDQCEMHCDSIGLELSAVAIMANNVGCVCQSRSQVSDAGALERYASGTAGGMAAVLMQQQAEEQQRQQAAQSNSY